MKRAAAPIALVSVLLAACGKSAKTRHNEIENCSAITLDAAGITKCLTEQYRWKTSDAVAAGQARQHQLDITAQHQRDSVWTVGTARHRAELATCSSQGGDVGRCLTDRYGWDADHATAAFDSVWNRQSSRHVQEIRTCQRKTNLRLGSCLQLYYKWDPRHALALDDSLERAKMRAKQHK
jgi:hypothetical protein